MAKKTSGEFAALLDIELREADRNHVIITVPVEGKRQPYGLMHGGMNAVLVEHAGSLLGEQVCPEGLIPVGTRVEAEHLRPVRAGVVSAEATVLAQSSAGATISVDIRNDAGQRTSRGELTLVFIPPERLA